MPIWSIHWTCNQQHLAASTMVTCSFTQGTRPVAVADRISSAPSKPHRASCTPYSLTTDKAPGTKSGLSFSIPRLRQDIHDPGVPEELRPVPYNFEYLLTKDKRVCRMNSRLNIRIEGRGLNLFLAAYYAS